MGQWCSTAAQPAAAEEEVQIGRMPDWKLERRRQVSDWLDQDKCNHQGLDARAAVTLKQDSAAVESACAALRVAASYLMRRHGCRDHRRHHQGKVMVSTDLLEKVEDNLDYLADLVGVGTRPAAADSSATAVHTHRRAAAEALDHATQCAPGRRLASALLRA